MGRRQFRSAKRGLAARLRAAVLLMAFAGVAIPPVGAGPLEAGGFSFSDELGGFAIDGVSGSGSQRDPILLNIRLVEVEPVLIVIRRNPARAPIEPYSRTGQWLALHLRLVIRNESGRVWQGFEVELQEIRDEPSVHEDGLSFDQGAMVPADISSSRFTLNHRLYEPYDRIRFREGHVNPGDIVDFRVHVTDPTPVNEFYLLLDPEILYSWRVVPGRQGGEAG